MKTNHPQSEDTSQTPHLENLKQQYTGKLLIRSEIDLDDETFNQLEFKEIPSILRKKLYPKCQRCGNQKTSLFGKIPCKSCHQTHLYCRKCIEMGRMMECKSLYMMTDDQVSWPQHHSPCTWKGELTTAQQKAAERMVQAVTNHESELLIWAVCGAGKTEMLFQGISQAFIQGKRVCIATPRADVVRELYPRIQQAFAGISVQALYGGSPDKDGSAQLIIATTHQLLRFSQAFDLLIIDEIDAFPFHKDTSLAFAANRAKKKVHTTIYLTATPRQKHRLQIALKKLPHIFVPVRYHGYPLPIPVYKMCHSLKKDLKRFTPPRTFFKWIQSRENPNRQLLIFVPTIELAEQMKGILATLLIKEGIIQQHDLLDSVHAEDKDREEKVQQFRKKEVTVLITTTILERGVTFPSVDVAVIDAGNRVFDEAALVQIAGRAGRSADDPTGEVVFFHDGKTEAMVQAIQSIKRMNRRGGFKG